MVFGKIDYDPCSEPGENLKLTAKGKPDSISKNTSWVFYWLWMADTSRPPVSTYAERLSAGDSKLSVHISVYGATLHSFNRERSTMMGVRKPALMESEIGGMSFVVHDIDMSEWQGMCFGSNYFLIYSSNSGGHKVLIRKHGTTTINLFLYCEVGVFTI